MSFKSINTILFDLDGTLVDSLPGIRASFEYLLESELIDSKHSPDEILKWIGMPLENLMLDLADGDAQRADFLVNKYREHNRRLIPSMPLFPGCLEMLRTFTSKGFTVGLVTSKNRISAMVTIDTHEIEHFFKIILAKEDTEKHKPHPEPIINALTKLGAKAEHTAYVGDSVYDILSAKAAGCLDIAAMWGAIDPQAVLKENPTVKLSSLSELTTIFDGP